MNLRSFSFYSDYSYPLTLSNVGEPSWSWIVTISKLRKRNKISSLLVYVFHKTQNLTFSRRSRAKTGKKCTKKRDARVKLLFCLLNLLFFWRRPRLRILKSLMTTTTKGEGEEKDDRRWTLQALLNYSFSISSRRIPIASLICSCLYHLPTDATRGITSFRKKSILWHYLCLAFVHKMGRVKQKIRSFSHRYILSV